MLLNRTAHIDEYEGRTLIGRAVTFNREYTVSDGGPSYVESYAPTAFNRTLGRKPHHQLYTLHDTTQLPIGRVTWQVTDEALMFRAEVAKTQAGDDVLELVRMEVLNDFSIGARAVAPVKPQNGRIHRTEVELREGSLVPVAALEDAGVLTVRSAEEHAADLERRMQMLKVQFDLLRYG